MFCHVFHKTSAVLNWEFVYPNILDCCFQFFGTIWLFVWKNNPEILCGVYIRTVPRPVKDNQL